MKLNYKRTFLIGFAFLSISAFWQMYDNIVPLILQNSFKLDETIIGSIMAIDNVLAVFLLPVFGILSDKCTSKLGRRTPFIIIGTFLAVVCMMLLPAADNSNRLILFVVALGITLLSMAFYRSPAVALMPDLTPKPLRSQANSIINLMGAIGGLYSLMMIKVLVGKGERPSYYPLFISVAGLMVLAVVLLVLTIREKRIADQIMKDYPDVADSKEDSQVGATQLAPEVKRSLVFILLSIFLWFTAYNAVTTAFSRYATTVWKLEGGGFADCLMVATVAAIISYIPVGIAASKIGRKKTILIGIALMTVCYLMGFLFKSYHPIINIGFACIGIGWAAIGVNSLPMVVEMCKGGDVGRYTGLYYTFSMSAQIITPIASGYLLGHVSYRTLFPYAMVFSALAFVTMSMVKHGDSKPERKKKIIENFDVED